MAPLYAARLALAHARAIVRAYFSGYLIGNLEKVCGLALNLRAIDRSFNRIENRCFVQLNASLRAF